MKSRERVATAVNHQVPDRVPIDLGGMKASGIAAIAYDRVKRKLGISTPTKVLDPRFMIAAVEDEVLRRLHVDVVPLDLSCVLPLIRPDSEWIPRRLFDGTNVLFPPGTRIAEDAAGNWILLNADGSPIVVPDAEERLLLRRHVVQPGRPHRPAEVPARVRHFGRASGDAERVRPVALSEHRLRHPRLGIRRVLPRPEPDHRPHQQRDARASPTSG